MNLKKAIFMLKKFQHDLKTPDPRYPVAKDMLSSKLGEYYFVFREDRIAAGADQKLLNHFDENGIPINKTYIDVTDKDFVYFPITIGQMGLSIFHTWLDSGDEEDRARFLKFAKWFADNAEIDSELGARWLTDVSLPQYQNPGPWQSAFSQARGINILLRGYQLAGNTEWAQLAEKALIPFTKSVEEGGVTSFTPWGAFYEEYVSTVPTTVLNGMIFALFGIYDFVRVFPENKLAKSLFEQGIKTLENVLPEFDLGFWSRYNHCIADWHPEIDPATIGYQRLHVVQLECLYRITGNDVFKKYRSIFQKQDTFINACRMYVLKFKSLKKIGRL